MMDLLLKPGHQHLNGILTIRLIMVICQLVMMWFLRHSTSSQLHLLAAGLVLLLLAVYSCFTLLQLRSDSNNKTTTHNQKRIFAELSLDAIALTGWLYFLGGAQNPFVSYYLVPVCISAALLPSRYTWGLFTICLGAYSLLFFLNQPLTDLNNAHSHHSSTNTGFTLHFAGMWANFLVSASLISYFISRMASTVRRQQQQLNHLREEQLQNEQIQSMASLAAGTAHELGTPLNSLVLLLEQQSSTIDPDKFELMQQQVQRCQTLLKKLVSTAQANESSRSSLKLYLQQLTDHWQLMRADVSYQLDTGQLPANTEIDHNPLLDQALSNLLNNAADANPENITIKASWQDDCWQLDIFDHGSGFSSAQLQQLGSQAVETDKGLGVGLLISQTTLTRLGGSLKINNREDGQSGAHVSARVPQHIRATS